MSLGRGDHVFDAVVDDLDRPTGLVREQRRVPGDHRRVFLLPAETATGLCLHNADRRAGAKQAFECFDRIEWTLHRAEYRDAVILRNGDDAVWLDVDVLLMSRSIRSFHDNVGRGES